MGRRSFNTTLRPPPTPASCFTWPAWVSCRRHRSLFFLSVIAAGLGAYCLVKRLWDDCHAAVVAGLAYALAPYSLAAIYTRGAGAEALALAVLPWFLAAFCLLADGVTKLRVVLAATATCALVLSHNGISLLAIPSVAVAVAAVALTRRRYREGIGQAGAMLLGLGMSAFFWLPALVETGQVQMQAMTQGFYSATANLSDVTQLIQTTLDFDYAPGLFNRLGLAQMVLAGISVAALPLLPAHKQRVALLAAITLGLCTFLQTDAAIPFWTKYRSCAICSSPGGYWDSLHWLSPFSLGLLPGAASELLKRVQPARENATTHGALALAHRLGDCGAGDQDQPERRLRELGRQRRGRRADGIHAEPAGP